MLQLQPWHHADGGKGKEHTGEKEEEPFGFRIAGTACGVEKVTGTHHQTAVAFSRAAVHSIQLRGDFIHGSLDIGGQGDIGVVAVKAYIHRGAGIQVPFQVLRQTHHRIGLVFIEEILRVRRSVQHMAHLHVGRRVNHFHYFLARPGMVQVHHHHIDIPGIVVAHGRRKEDSNHDGHQEGHLFIGHAPAGKEEMDFIGQ